MKILGIDPGMERLGWGVIEKNGNELKKISSGVKKTLKTSRKSARLLEIFEFLNKLIKKERPDTLSTEKLFFAKNVKTALIIGEVRGIILTVAEAHGLAIKEFAPLEVKVAICGYGRADKQAVANMVKLMLNLPKKELLDDETDALALAIIGASYKAYP